MYLSYYQHPELQLLDEERCEDYVYSPKCELLKAARMDSRKEVKNINGSEVMTRDEFLEFLHVFFTDGPLAGKIRNIYYPSRTFDDALEKSYKAFEGMVRTPTTLIDVHEDCCFITGERRKVKTFVMFDCVYDGGWNKYWLVETVDGVMTFLALYSMKKEHEELRANLVWRPEHEHSCFDGQDDVTVLWWRLEMVYSYLVFKKYSDVELEVVCREKTLRKSGILHEKVNNFMGINVTLLDSNWFTTICRNEGFAVSGHFRLQPYKTGPKLIYIKPYTKNGYHRQARIEKE